jgi:hypothetical protein
LRLSAVRLIGAGGATQADLPDSEVSLSIPWLLRGSLAPSRLELRGPALHLRRAEDGAISLQLSDPAPAPAAPGGVARLSDLLDAMMHPPDAATPLGALSRLAITGAQVTVEDAQLGTTWSLDAADIALRRLPAGGIAARATAMLRLGDTRVPVTLAGEATGTPAEAGFTLTLPAVRPSALADVAPALAPLAALDAQARLQVGARLSPNGTLHDATARLETGAGSLDLGEGRRIAIAALQAGLAWTEAGLRLDPAILRLEGPGSPTLTAQATARRGGPGWQAAATLTLDAMPAEAIGRWWPADLVPGAREWVTENVTAGTARNGRWRFGAEAAVDLSDIRLTEVSGTVDVEGATAHWLRPIPPIEEASGQVTFGMEEVTVRVAAARQAGTALRSREATVRLLFPDGAEPQAEIEGAVTGPLPELLTVLQHPRLRLFERRPLPLKDPQGTLDGRVTIAFPLLADLPIERLRVGAQARLRQVRLADILLGRPLERGQFDVTMDNERLRVSGTATLADITARVGVDMDLRSGPANQIVMRETVQARAQSAQLAALGLASEELVRGPVGLDVRTERRRNGAGRVAIRAELREASLAIEPLGWSKPAGQIAGATGTLRLNGDTLEAIENFRVEAPDLLLRGNAAFGRGARFERVTIGEARIEASRLAGEARPPARPGAPWSVTLRGQVLDLRRAFGEDAPADAPAAEPGPAVAIDGQFDRVLLGPERELAGVGARVQVDGRGVLRQGRLTGRTGPNGAFQVDIVPAGSGRRLEATAADAGALLAQFGVLRHLEGGRLRVAATYAHNGPGAPLSGTAEMDDFAVRNAPAFGKLLQAMTLYGLLEAMAGPGLGFSRLIAPFTLTPETLTLADARAFSASLGLTAKGTLDRRRQRLAMEGTIVPAYIFNSLLGNIPILGRLFSPEAGGGVFAATFRLQGPLDDPQVSVNPLAALTPGFLRGLFGIGQQPAQP